MDDIDAKKHLFCVNCGTKLVDNANFCGACGCPVTLDLLSENENSCEVVNETINMQEKVIRESVMKAHVPFILTIAEKRYTIRKNYIIRDSQGDVLYTAKSEGLPKMPEIVVYKKDKQVGKIEKELFAKPFWGDSEYTLQWKGKIYASLQRKRTLKRVYEIPEHGWRFEFGVMTSKLYDKNNSLLMTMGRIISSTQDRYSVEYYDVKNEPAAVLFALIDAMNVDLE